MSFATCGESVTQSRERLVMEAGVSSSRFMWDLIRCATRAATETPWEEAREEPGGEEDLAHRDAIAAA